MKNQSISIAKAKSDLSLNGFAVLKGLLSNSKELEDLKDNLVYSVDKMEQLHYIRGQIKGLESLLQDLKDLLTTTEYDDEQVHGDTETD